MRYTKPHIVGVAQATMAVQMTGNAPNGKNSTQIQDNPVNALHRSTTGAYEADE